MVSLRAAPLPGPAPAANTTAPAPAIAAATSSTPASSRSRTTGSLPSARRSSAWAGLRISPRTRSPRAATTRARRRATLPCPPAITTSIGALSTTFDRLHTPVPTAGTKTGRQAPDSVPDMHAHAPASEARDAQDLARFGYPQQLRRRLGSYASFAAGFSFVSILTTVFQLFGFGFSFGGASFFWTWPLVFGGQLLVALCFAELAARYPIS